ncbi:Chromatin assembly factor 1 subunit FSM, partial [Dichanthelium oligosanthes]
MDGHEAKESAPDCASGADSAMCLDASCEHESMQPAKKQQKRKRASSEMDIVHKESASAEWQQEIDALYEYYREVSGHHLNPEELACLTGDSIIACLLEESSLPCAKLTDNIYKRMKLQDGVTRSSVRNSVLNIGKLAAKDTPNTRSNEQNGHSVNAVEVLNLDEICSFMEKSKQKNDADITKMHSKTKAQVLQATRKAVKEQQIMSRQIENEQTKKILAGTLIYNCFGAGFSIKKNCNIGKCNEFLNNCSDVTQDRELKHMKEKAERETKRFERENKRLKKHQKEAERGKKRKEKEEAELKRQASTKKQANFMECLFIRKPNNNIECSGSHHLEKTTCSKSSGIIEELAVAATSAMDCTLSQANHLRTEEFWVAHVSRWRKLSQHNRLHHWGVRRSPKVQLFPVLKLLQKSSATAPSDNMSTPTKEQSSQESTGSIDLNKLLGELKTPSHEKNIPSRTAQNSISSSVLFVKKLLQFDRSFRPAYYSTWRKKRRILVKDSDFEEDEKTMKEHDSDIDVEEETENSFVVPNDYLSGDEGVQYEPVSVKSDETCSMLSNPGVTVDQKFLHSATEDALAIDRPLVISNLDHRKLDLLKAEDITAEKLCLQALCMKKYPSGPIIDVPVVVKVTMEDQAFCRSNKKSPARTPVPSKSIADLDMPEFLRMGKLVDLLHERFTCVSKAQLKNRNLRSYIFFMSNKSNFLNRLRRKSWISTVYVFLR